MEIINDSLYNEKVMTLNKGFVLVFISKTCPHCRTVEKFMEKIEREEKYKGIKIFLVQGEQSPKLIDLFKVSAFPTTHFFKDDKSGVKRIVGADVISSFFEGFELINNQEKSFLKKIFKRN